jgi:hypothetical protein
MGPVREGLLLHEARLGEGRDALVLQDTLWERSGKRQNGFGCGCVCERCGQAGGQFSKEGFMIISNW